MGSDDVSLVPTQRLDPSINAQLLFQDENALRFGCSSPHPRVGDPAPKTRELSGFMDDKLFSIDRDRFFAPQGTSTEFRRCMYSVATDRRDPPERQNWNGNEATSTDSGGDGSDGEEDEDEEEDDDDDDDDEGDGEVEGLVGIDTGDKNNSSGGVSVIGYKIDSGNSKGHVPFGISSDRERMMKDGSMVQSGSEMNRASTIENDQQRQVGHIQSVVTTAEPDGDMFCSQFMHGSEGSGQVQKDMAGDNGCRFSGRKDGSVSSDPGELLRAIFSDPIT